MVERRSPKAYMGVRFTQLLPAERRLKSKGGTMTQTEMNFLQEAMYFKCDALLKTIADNANASMKKEKQTATKKGETK